MARIPAGLASINPVTSPASRQSGIFGARVKIAITDDQTYPNEFQTFGEWSSIGCIFFERLNTPNPNPSTNLNSFARPLFPNNSNIPLKNEIVYVIGLPNANVQSNVNDIAYYYFQSVNIWNSTHHNAIPDPVNTQTLPESQQQDYEETSAGIV